MLALGSFRRYYYRPIQEVLHCVLYHEPSYYPMPIVFVFVCYTIFHDKYKHIYNQIAVFVKKNRIKHYHFAYKIEYVGKKNKQRPIEPSTIYIFIFM